MTGRRSRQFRTGPFAGGDEGSRASGRWSLGLVVVGGCVLALTQLTLGDRVARGVEIAGRLDVGPDSRRSDG